MNKFKTGDIVGYKNSLGEVGPLVVDYQHTNSTEVWFTNGLWMKASRLFLWEDELPPAPESVQYTTLQYDWQHKYNDQYLKAEPNSFGDAICIRIQGSTTSERNKDRALSVILSPDEILQLCHDLCRMAMDLKRKEKNNA